MGILALVVSGLSLVATLLLKSAQREAAIDLQTEASQIVGVDIFNPFTWGGVVSNIQQVPEAIGAWIRFQAITIAMYTVAIGGALLSGYIIWIDYFGGPTPRQIAETAALATPAGRAARVAKEVAGSNPKHNPAVSFERGTRARAVRDLLAKRIERAGGAREPFAVATAKVQKEGTRKAARGIPKREIEAELREAA